MSRRKLTALVPLMPLLLLLALPSCPVKPKGPGEPGEAADEANASAPAPPSATEGEPTIRVGLTEDAARAVVGCTAGYEVRGPDGVLLARVSELERLAIEPVAALAEASLMVQLSSLGDAGAARAAALRAAILGAGEARLVPDPDSGRTAVRLGPFATRERADAVRLRARSAGWDGAFIVPAPVGPARRGALSLRIGGRSPVSAPPAVHVGSPTGGPLELDGVAYDGGLEVYVNSAGRLTVVDTLPLELYLRGVVPNELGPEQFPSLAALEAQAVAARTYAIANLGRSAVSGFDICATPRCQVYRGVATHHPLSDEAIERTRGMVLTSAGVPIRALFTSTCGGHTEDVEAIFGGEPAPYLRGVPCEPEVGQPARGQGVTRMFAEDGDLVNEEVALARLLSLDVPAAPPRAWLERKATWSELRSWIGRGGALAGIGQPALAAPARLDRNALARALVDGLGLAPRIAMRAPGSAGALALAPDRATVADAAAWSHLLELRALHPFPDGTLRPRQEPSRAATLRAVVRVMAARGLPRLVGAIFESYRNGEMVYEQDGSRVGAPVLPSALLFRDVRGVAFPAAELPLAGGDQLRLHRGNGGIDFVVGIGLGKGTHYDRFSKYAEWEVSLSLAELEERFADRGVRGLRDLEVSRRTATGRVTRLVVHADSGDVTLTGLDVRFGLGVRENLFEIERVRNGAAIERFRFVGRGFGHGVGLCQVGAYGMALGGSSFEAILAHYYRGATLEHRY